MIPDCIRIRDAPPISKGWMVGEVRGGGGEILVESGQNLPDTRLRLCILMIPLTGS